MSQSTVLLERLDAPSVAPATMVRDIRDYREAVRMAWKHRRVMNMTRATLCEMTGMRPSHVTDYLSEQETDAKGNALRDMPAKYLPLFEAAVGNAVVSQWLAEQSQLTILESQIAEKQAERVAKVPGWVSVPTPVRAMLSRVLH